MVKIILEEGKIVIDGSANELQNPSIDKIIQHYITAFMKPPIAGSIAFSEKKNGNGMPKIEAIIEVIKSNQNYLHDIREISSYFFGRTFKSSSKDREEKRHFDILWKRTKRARDAIARKEHGTWVKNKEGFGVAAKYYFRKA